MATGILFPFVGILFHPLGFMTSLICECFVLMLVFIVEISPKVPFAVFNVDIPLFILFLVYLPTIYLFARAKEKKDLDFLRQ